MCVKLLCLGQQHALAISAHLIFPLELLRTFTLLHTHSVLCSSNQSHYGSWNVNEMTSDYSVKLWRPLNTLDILNRFLINDFSVDVGIKITSCIIFTKTHKRVSVISPGKNSFICLKDVAHSSSTKCWRLNWIEHVKLFFFFFINTEWHLDRWTCKEVGNCNLHKYLILILFFPEMLYCLKNSKTLQEFTFIYRYSSNSRSQLHSPPLARLIIRFLLLHMLCFILQLPENNMDD